MVSRATTSLVAGKNLLSVYPTLLEFIGKCVFAKGQPNFFKIKTFEIYQLDELDGSYKTIGA